LAHTRRPPTLVGGLIVVIIHSVPLGADRFVWGMARLAALQVVLFLACTAAHRDGRPGRPAPARVYGVPHQGGDHAGHRARRRPRAQRGAERPSLRRPFGIVLAGSTALTMASATGNGRSEPRITVVFLLHYAVEAVADLVAALARQHPPAGADPARWVEVIFNDDASTDGTVERLEAELAAAKLPFAVRVLRNEENLGLSRSLNRALASVETEYVLTCHLDCRFASDDYVAHVIDLLDRHPHVGVVSGQPIADVERGLSRVEKVYFAANLMDVFPDGAGELEPVGFAEGRCDGFRLEVLRETGFYDTTVRRAGEDQVLAARIRAAGYRVCRAPGLRYYLSVSASQDSLLKLVRHAYLFGRVHPYLLLANRGTAAGVAGPAAGRNRSLRMMLRACQLAGAVTWVGLGAAAATRRWRGPAVAAVVAANALKSTLFVRYVRELRFDARDVGVLTAVQPALDVAYGTGIAKGLWQLAGRGERTIA
jgi:GT2 family glycosyltransferase